MIIAICTFITIMVICILKKDWIPNLLGYPIDDVEVRTYKVKNELYAFAWARLLRRGSEDSYDVVTFIFSFLVLILLSLVVSVLWIVVLPITVLSVVIRKVLKSKIKNN